MTIRVGHNDDLSELQQLFVDTVKSICKTDYNREQIIAWTSGIENNHRWKDILANQFVLVAQENEKITGFCTLDKGNYIDLLYVHKDYQRKGIAYKLYADIEKEAKRQRQSELTSDVSKTSKKFFEKVGFKVLQKQTVNVRGVELTNYKMTKPIE
ncbi:MAG TPA: GNAT family N-acetyltransferase [Sphingobacteriaceae bacterium]|nr:GNAT family N-acetyltransferase [Sphingobacteriaceae bacterium]